MGMIKSFLTDKVKVGIVAVCLLMLGVVGVANNVGDTYAATTNVCIQCNGDSSIVKSGTSTGADGTCPSGYHYVDDSNCQYTVSFNTDGGTSVADEVVKIGESIVLPASTKAGYSFGGWEFPENVIWKVGQRFQPKSNVTMKAIWIEESCYVCGTNPNFLKWADKIPNGDNFCAYYILDDSISYNDCVSFKIEYNANGGSGAPSAQYQSKNDTVVLSSVEPTRAGYKFLGWSSNSSSTFASYKAGEAYTFSGNRILYAIWEKISACYFCESSGSYEWSLDTPSTVCENGKWEIVNKNITECGHSSCYVCSSNAHILKWGDNSNDTICSSGYTNSNITKENCVTYTISYDANGGRGAPSKQYLEKKGTIVLSATVPTRAGYKFLGWSSNSASTSASYKAGESYTFSGNRILYAVWEAEKYNISFNTDGGNSINDMVVTYDTNITLPTPVKSGFTFINWELLNSNLYYPAGKGFNVSFTSDVTLKAKWEPNNSSDAGDTDAVTYTISYNANGGRGAPSSQKRTKGDKDFTLSSTKPTRIGYTFKGWGTSVSDTSVDYAAGAKYTSNSSTTLYAIWNANTYTIKYDGNGSTSGSTASSSHTYDELKTLTTNGYTKTDCTFGGWNTEADGSGTSYTDKQSVKNLISTNDGEMILYAQWLSGGSSDSGDDDEEQKITYYVRYNSNEGTGSMKNSTHIYNVASNLTNNAFKREGYIFVEWNTEIDGSGDSYTDGQTISNLSSKDGDTVTLFAQWSKVEGADDNDDPPQSGDDGSSGTTPDGGKDELPEKSPQTGILATILVSLIGIGAFGGVVYYRKKVKI